MLEREHVLDILVNNAGASWGGPIDDFPEAGWDKVMDTNVKAVFFLTQKLLPLLRAAAAGPTPARVINIGSIDGLQASAFDTLSYGPSKAAVHHLTRFMASRLTPERILFNAIAPGPVPDLDAVHRRRLRRRQARAPTGTRWANATPAAASARRRTSPGWPSSSCSRAGAYMVGQVITCDGGIVVSAGTGLK